MFAVCVLFAVVVETACIVDVTSVRNSLAAYSVVAAAYIEAVGIAFTRFSAVVLLNSVVSVAVFARPDIRAVFAGFEALLFFRNADTENLRVAAVFRFLLTVNITGFVYFTLAVFRAGFTAEISRETGISVGALPV